MFIILLSARFFYAIDVVMLLNNFLARQCDALSEVAHGYYRPNNCTTEKHDVGSVCTLACQQGFYPDVDVTLECTISSEWWSRGAAKCEGRQVISITRMSLTFMCLQLASVYVYQCKSSFN